MRAFTLTAILSLLVAHAASGQLRFLGTDKLPKGVNPYDSRQLSGGIVSLGNDLYFTTPTGRLYRTDGTENGTEAVYTAKGQSIPILAATSKYLYLGLQDPGYASFMHRYEPGSKKAEPLTLEDPSRAFRFNNNRLPGYNLMADALAVSPDRKRIAFRIFMNDAISLNVISDDAPGRVKMVKYCSPMEIASQDMSIYASSEIAFVRNDIFVNGFERDLLTAKMGVDASGRPTMTRTGARAFTASSVTKKPGDATTWYLGSYYFVESQGYTLFKGLMECSGKLYSLVRKEGGNNAREFKLVRYDSAKLSLSNAALPGDTYYTTEVHDDAIYLLTTGFIYRYDAAADRFMKIYSDAGSGWNPVFDTDLMLKCGKYLLTRSRERVMLIDESTGKALDVSGAAPNEEPNRFSFGDRYAWASRRAFFTIESVGGKPTFTRFAPDTKASRSIVMPDIDRASFTRFRAVFQSGDSFLLLTEYRDRKGAPVYNMFMYRDEAS